MLSERPTSSGKPTNRRRKVTLLVTLRVLGPYGQNPWRAQVVTIQADATSYPPRTRTWTDGTKIRSAAITPGGKVRTFSRECRNHKSIGHYVLRFITLEDLP